MDAIICNISALEVLRTPPQVRRATLTPWQRDLIAPRMPALGTRRNSPIQAKIIAHGLLGELKGVSLPVHLLFTDGKRRCSPHVIWHSPTRPLEPGDLIPLEDGLFVTSPLRTLEDLALCMPLIEVLRLAYELCGMYAMCPETHRVRCANDVLYQPDSRAGHSGRPTWGPKRFAAFHDIDGSLLHRSGPDGIETPWEPCLTASGEPTSMWKRPPLVDLPDLRTHAERLVREARAPRGAQRFARATQLAIPGSASPAETITSIMLSGSRHLGMEGVRRITLNRRIALSSQAAASFGAPFCVPDLTFEDSRGRLLPLVADFDSKTFHQAPTALMAHSGDRRDDAARRTALQESGYNPVTITYSQLIDSNRWETLVSVLRRGLGMTSVAETSAFRRQRARLRYELFGRDGLPPMNECLGI